MAHFTSLPLFLSLLCDFTPHSFPLYPPLVSNFLPPFLPSLAPSAGCCWNCWSFCLTSSRQWPRLTVWCWPICRRLRCSARVGPMKRASSSTNRLTSLPRSRQCCRSDMSNTVNANVPKPLIYVFGIALIQKVIQECLADV